MQPSETITTNSGSQVFYDLTLLDLSPDYQRQRPWLLAALGVTEDDLRQWESPFTAPPTIETFASPDDDQDFEITPRGETEFILDDPDEEDEEDEDSEPKDADDEDEDDDDDDESEDDDEDPERDESGDDDEFEDADEGDFDPDDVTVDEDDGEG